ncbi:MAG TPA: hypothetical protein VKU60_17815, partial [Chloroflexota bacterium]|nr:hypothetical protein [Chloroflexota bacterium]
DWDERDTANLTNSFAKLVQMGTMHEDEPQIRERLHLAPATPETKQKLDEKRQEVREMQRQNLATKTTKSAPGAKEK